MGCVSAAPRTARPPLLRRNREAPAGPGRGGDLEVVRAGAEVDERAAGLALAAEAGGVSGGTMAGAGEQAGTECGPLRSAVAHLP